jgi:mannose-1-phosphate guanylyltransferase
MPLLKAFLLVAGRGERLRPLTDTTPKCLLPIHGTTMLQIWLEHLEHSGIDEVLVNTHWLHDKVKDVVEQWSALHKRLKMILRHEPELLGTAGTLLHNRRWAGTAPFFIIFGDNLTQADLRKMLAFHEKNGQPLTIRVYRGADPGRSAIVLLDGNGIVIDFAEKPKQPKSDLGAGGIYIADSRIFEYYPEQPEEEKGAALDLSYDILPRMAGRMQAYDSGEFSMDIGTPESLAMARRKWLEMMPADA